MYEECLSTLYLFLTHFLLFPVTASFEVTINGKLVYSKLSQGAFPVFKEVYNSSLL